MSERGTRGGLRRLAWCAATGLSALWVTAAVSTVSATAGDAGDGPVRDGMRYLGVLPADPAHVSRDGDQILAGPYRGHMYRLYHETISATERIAEYDLSSTLPQLTRDVDLGVAATAFDGYGGPYFDAIDTRRNVLIRAGQQSGAGLILYRVDLSSLTLVSSWDVTATLPGFASAGMTYSAADDRIYMVGNVEVNSIIQALWNTVATQTAALVAMQADAPTLDYVAPLRNCPALLDTLGVGTPLFRSLDQPALYTACYQGSANVASFPVLPQLPGSATVVRVDIDPNAGQAAALTMPQEHFPISGTYINGAGTSGAGAFDPATDRFFLLSQAVSTPGAWVFDGRRSEWAGFVAAPDYFDQQITVGPRDGHVYIGGLSSTTPGYIVVADGRQDPVPQGAVVWADLGAFHQAYAPMGADEQGRLYVPTNPDGQHLIIAVLRDETPAARPLRPVDFDAGTADVPEGPTTTSTYAGDAAVFGSRVALVGGSGGLCAAQIAFSFTPDPACAQAGLRRGDRVLTAARIGGVDLRGIDATAGAQALTPDQSTQSDVQTESDQLGGAAAWPWNPVACNDTTGRQPVPQSQQGPGGTASVTCDLGAAQSLAAAHYDAIGFPGVTVHASDASVTAHREAAHGMVVEAGASVSGVVLSGGGTVSIGRVSAVARTQAQGRTGSSATSWQRVLENVSITDAGGQPLARCARSDSNPADPCDIDRLVDLMNTALAGRALVTLPQAEQTVTPRGAFAAVRKSAADQQNDQTVNDDDSRAVSALQVEVYNDGPEKSRLLWQLAAVDATSLYQVSRGDLVPNDTNSPDQPTTVSGSDTTAGVLSQLPADTLAAPAPAPARRAPGTAAPRTAGDALSGFGLLLRRPADAALFASLWLLLASAPTAVWRRQRLHATTRRV